MLKGKALFMHPRLRPAAEELWAMGYKLSTVSSWRDIGIRDAIGVHNKSKMRIMLVRYRNGKRMTLSDMAFVLAHELRHAQHIRDGLYKMYYDRDRPLKYSDLPVMIGVGYRAELDCDRFARKYLKDLGLYSKFSHRRYSKKKVGLYCLYKRNHTAKLYIKSLLKESPKALIKKRRYECEKWSKNYLKDRYREPPVRNKRSRL